MEPEINVSPNGDGYVRFRQLLGSTPVVDGDVVVRLEAGRVRAIFGPIVPDSKAESIATLDEFSSHTATSLAEAQLLAYVDSGVEAVVDGTSYLEGAGERLFVAREDALVWRFRGSNQRGQRFLADLDASTGDLLHISALVEGASYNTSTANIAVEDCYDISDLTHCTMQRGGARSRLMDFVAPDVYRLEYEVSGRALEHLSDQQMWKSGGSYVWAYRQVDAATIGNNFLTPAWSADFGEQSFWYWMSEYAKYARSRMYDFDRNGVTRSLVPSSGSIAFSAMSVVYCTSSGAGDCVWSSQCAQYHESPDWTVSGGPLHEYGGNAAILIDKEKCIDESWTYGIPHGTVVVHEFTHHLRKSYPMSGIGCSSVLDSRTVSEGTATLIGALFMREHTTNANHTHDNTDYWDLENVNHRGAPFIGAEFEEHDCDDAAVLFDGTCSGSSDPYIDMVPLVQALWEIAFNRRYISTPACTNIGLGFSSIGAARDATMRGIYAAYKNSGTESSMEEFANEFLEWIDNADKEGSQLIASRIKDVFSHHGINSSYVP